VFFVGVMVRSPFISQRARRRGYAAPQAVEELDGELLLVQLFRRFLAEQSSGQEELAGAILADEAQIGGGERNHAPRCKRGSHAAGERPRPGLQ
jgi:hypothetical protein